jgi:hypothetical protein
MWNRMCKYQLVLVFLFAPMMLSAQEFDNGFGLRLGDPFGFTYKNYISPTRAVEFIAGTSGKRWNTSYYKRSFNRVNRFEDYLYYNHRLDYTVAVNARYLFHNKFKEDVDGLQWYYGAGLHLRFASVEYEYIRREDIDNFQQANRFFEGHFNYDIGPEIIIGTEYTLYDAPITFYGEVSLFAEIVDNPFAFRFYGAFGIRYNWNR